MNVKNWIGNKITNLKLKMKEYFLLKNSLEHLENYMKRYYVFSIGFNDICYGNKNIKRLKICIINWVFGWFAMLYFLLFVLSDKMFSLMNVPSISDQHLKLLWTLGVLGLFAIAVIRTDNLYGEINYNLSPYKVIYYLMKDLKQLHKLNEKNYKKLAILSRSIQILLVDCGYILVGIVAILFFIKMAILSGKIFWTCGIIILILIFVTSATTSASTVSLYIIIFAYYAMIFGQINHGINLILNEKATLFRRRKLINRTKQKQLIRLINEHNLAAIEIHKINLIIRRSVGCLFISFAIIKIILLYLMVNFNDFLIKLLLIQMNFFILIFGFAFCYLFTLQIKLAHQPFKTVHSIVCKYRMNLQLKSKVS